ncbi:hypothetical protein [Catenulispora sp. MAP12-49]|uniref:hypothetical protein n=1 Tax=Catenulispora sp. MAP12-49 TaxID=3156302 RepID=UPI003516A40C
MTTPPLTPDSRTDLALILEAAPWALAAMIGTVRAERRCWRPPGWCGASGTRSSWTRCWTSPTPRPRTVPPRHVSAPCVRR